MGEAPGAAAVLGAVVLAEGGRRAGGDAGEAVGEAVVGDAGEAVVGVVGGTWASRTKVRFVYAKRWRGAHRSRLLEGDLAEVAACGDFDGLLGLLAQAVVL